MNLGPVAAILGTILGCIGGCIGAYCSYKAANGPRARRFVVWASLALVVLISSFLVALSLLPQLRACIWTFYIVALVFGIRFMNRRHSKIQREEQTR